MCVVCGGWWFVGSGAGGSRSGLAPSRDEKRAWAWTVQAVKGAALSGGVELAGWLIATAAWVVGVVLTH